LHVDVQATLAKLDLMPLQIAHLDGAQAVAVRRVAASSTSSAAIRVAQPAARAPRRRRVCSSLSSLGVLSGVTARQRHHALLVVLALALEAEAAEYATGKATN
jgi:hypothetical protein